MSVTPVASSPATARAIPQCQHPTQSIDSSSSLGSAKSTKSSKLGQTPPYWNRHKRTVSNISYVSINASTRRAPIQLEDHTEETHETSDGLWAKGVLITGYHVVSGSAIGAGAYVVWHCSVQTLAGGSLNFQKRYSEFDALRLRLAQTFPHSPSALPGLPPKSVVSWFRARFLEKRREGLQFFLTCVLLNPGFAGSPILKDFIFS